MHSEIGKTYMRQREDSKNGHLEVCWGQTTPSKPYAPSHIQLTSIRPIVREAEFCDEAKKNPWVLLLEQGFNTILRELWQDVGEERDAN